MPLDLPTLNRHLAKVVGDLPITFIHQGRTIGPTGVTRGPISEDQRLLMGGLDLKLDSIVSIRKSDYPAVTFSIGDLVIIGAEEFKIHDIEKSPDAGQLWRLTLAWARR